MTALSLPASRSLSDLSSSSQIDTHMRKAPPSTLTRPGRSGSPANHSTRESDSPTNRPSMVSLDGHPYQRHSLPPDALPNWQHSAAARSRFGSLPALFRPTGRAWVNSPLAHPKAAPPPAPAPKLRLLKAPERWYYFPTVSPQWPLIRRSGTAPQSSKDPESDSSSVDDDEGHAAKPTQSEGPTLSWYEWD